MAPTIHYLQRIRINVNNCKVLNLLILLLGGPGLTSTDAGAGTFLGPPVTYEEILSMLQS